jgi:hypothetical protein
MGSGKKVRLDNIHIEQWKSLRDKGIRWLDKLFNEIMRLKQMFDQWIRSNLIPIYKIKVMYLYKLKEVKFMSHVMKLLEIVIERRLRKETEVT